MSRPEKAENKNQNCQSGSSTLTYPNLVRALVVGVVESVGNGGSLPLSTLSTTLDTVSRVVPCKRRPVSDTPNSDGAVHSYRR